MLVADPNVIFCVFVAFPKVKPVTVFAILKLVIGNVNALAKLLLDDSTVTFPLVFIAIPEAASAMLSPVIITSLVELVILPPCPIFIFEGPVVCPPVNSAAT